VQYGGRVTDTQDRKVLKEYTARWLCADATDPRFVFNPAPEGVAVVGGPGLREYKYTVCAALRWCLGAGGGLLEVQLRLRLQQWLIGGGIAAWRLECSALVVCVRARRTGAHMPFFRSRCPSPSCPPSSVTSGRCQRWRPRTCLACTPTPT
jgi:hypothetical protein